MIDVPKIC